MIYEVRTYDLKPGTVAQYEENFGKALPAREKYSKLAAFWHTDIGPLNQVIHVWGYESLEEREHVRAEASKADGWPPPSNGAVLNMNSEIWTPAPFMRSMGGDQALGSIYEMRTYTYAPGDIAKVFEAWGERIAEREKYSPLAGCWTTELGDLNRFIHLWAYKSLDERARVREESRASGTWPPPSGVSPLKQENKILIPAECSPMQ